MIMKSIRQIIQNILVEQLVKTDLYELASSRQDIRREIHSIVINITDHLIYLKLYPNNRTRAHWRTEIRTWIWRFSNERTKPNNKKLDVDTYFDYLYNARYENDLDYIEALIIEAIKKEGKSNVNLDISKFDKQLQVFYKKLAKLCADKKTVTHEDIMQLLDEWEKW